MAGERQGWAAGLFGWIERFVNLGSAIAGTGVVTVGGLTAWAASAANILSEYAPFSWVAAGIGGALLAALATLMISFSRLKWSQASATNKWKDSVSTINPLETTFRGQRIRIADLVPPVGHEIHGKTFIDCELVGPINLSFKATRPGSGGFTGVTFTDCDWVAARENAQVYNAALLVDCNFLRGQVFKVTFIVAVNEARHLSQVMPSIPWLTDLPNTTKGAADTVRR